MSCLVLCPAVDDSQERWVGNRSLYVVRQESILILARKGFTRVLSAHRAQCGGPYDRPQFGTDTEI